MNNKNKFASERIAEYFRKEQQTLEGSKYIVLHKAIKSCILNLELPSGWTLPSTRVLADDLHLSRTTVLKSYELLILEKLIVARPGSGYKTNYTPEPILPTFHNIFNPEAYKYPEISEKGKSYLKNTAIINRDSDDNVAFRPGLPPLDVFPINRWKNLVNTYWRYVKSSGLNYSQSSGVHELKKSICSYLNVSRNIKCQPDQIVVVSGSLQSLYLIANTLIEKGDPVLLENPVFPNVHSVFKSSQANVVPINLDDEGIDIQSANHMTDFHPKLIHVTPSNHYPLGIKMSLNRRQELLSYAEKQGSLIIENDYEHEIANFKNPMPSIFSLDRQDRTIYMGTFNRLLHPSIRLGYMIVPQYLKPAVEALQEHSHRFVPPSLQVVMQQFIEKNYLYQHINQCIEVAHERFDIFNAEFNKYIKHMTLQETEFSSFHRVAFFKSDTSPKEELALIQKLNDAGVKVLSLSKCYIGEPKKTGLIFGYSAVRPMVIAQKIQTLREFV